MHILWLLQYLSKCKYTPRALRTTTKQPRLFIDPLLAPANFG